MGRSGRLRAQRVARLVLGHVDEDGDELEGCARLRHLGRGCAHDAHHRRLAVNNHPVDARLVRHPPHVAAALPDHRTQQRRLDSELNAQTSLDLSLARAAGAGGRGVSSGDIALRTAPFKGPRDST